MSMSFAWEVTEEDIRNCLNAYNEEADKPVGVTDENVSEWHNDLDHGMVEDAALQGTEMDLQTTYSYGEICRQLMEAGVIDFIPEYFK